MVAVRLTPPLPFAVVGSPAYFEQHGRPKCAEDLRDHACLRLRRSGGAIAPWVFTDGNAIIEAFVSGPMIAHDYPTIVGAAVRGVGLGQVPHPIAAAALAEGRLEAVLNDVCASTSGVFLYHPGRNQVLPKLRAFIEHIKAKG
jgi:DNA-binding transcriptional LysR family regulator